MALYTREGRTFTPNQLLRMGVEDPEKLGFVIVQDVVPEHDSFKVKMVKTGRIINGFEEYKEEPLTPDEIKLKIKEHGKKVIKEVDVYMDCAICDICGYDNRDSIGKYLIKESPYYSECSKMSLWISSCYQKCFEIENDVIDGKITMPNIKDVLLQLPVASFLSEKDNGTLLERYNNKAMYNWSTEI